MYKVIIKEMTLDIDGKLEDAFVSSSKVRNFPSFYNAKKWIDEVLEMALESDQVSIGTGWDSKNTAYVFYEYNNLVSEYMIMKAEEYSLKVKKG